MSLRRNIARHLEMPGNVFNHHDGIVTTKPVEMVSAISVRLLMEKPARYITHRCR